MPQLPGNRDAHTRNLLIRVLAECGENRGPLEVLSQLELIDCVLEKCMWDTGEFAAFMMRLLITVNSDAEMLSLRIEHSEEEREKLALRIRELESRLTASEHVHAVLSHSLSMAHKHPGLEELRRFLAALGSESCANDLLAAGIDSMDKLRAAARRRGALAKTGIHEDVIAVMRRQLKRK
jgi:hypothetical protein